MGFAKLYALFVNPILSRTRMGALAWLAGSIFFGLCTAAGAGASLAKVALLAAIGITLLVIVAAYGTVSPWVGQAITAWTSRRGDGRDTRRARVPGERGGRSS